jgi:hypothetical protein
LLSSVATFALLQLGEELQERLCDLWCSVDTECLPKAQALKAGSQLVALLGGGGGF